ncbi:MAG: MoaD/ThiS family protein [Nitrospiraceae bacterium]
MKVTVSIPTPLRSYTAHNPEVEVEGRTLGEALAAIDRRYPGLRFRIITEQDTVRQHIKIFINGAQAGSLSDPLQSGDHLYIICALSGG